MIDLAAGQMIGSYRVVKRIAASRISSIYEIESGNGELFMAEVLSFSLNEEQRDLLGRLISFEHMYVIKILEMFEFDGRSILIMEHVKGEMIGERISRSDRVVISDRLETASQISEGLLALKERGFMHYNLNPDSIFVTEYGTVKIAGIGLLIFFHMGERFKENRDLETRTFSAPELFQEGDFEPEKCAVCSFGAMLYFLLTNKRPSIVKARSISFFFSRKVGFSPPIRINRKLSRPINGFILNCIAHNSQQRYQTLERVVGLLHGYIKQMKIERSKEIVRRGKSSSRAYLFFAVVGIVALSLWIFSKGLISSDPEISSKIAFVGERTDPWGNPVPFEIGEWATVYAEDRFQIFLLPDSDLYIVAIGFSNGKLSVLYPYPFAGEMGFARGGRLLKLPAESKWYCLDDVAGAENVYVILMRNEIPDFLNILSQPEIEMKQLFVFLRRYLDSTILEGTKNGSIEGNSNMKLTSVWRTMISDEKAAVFRLNLEHK